MNNIYFCPVCGYSLNFKAWNGQSASDEICPACGIQFGYDDALGGSKELRPVFYNGWRSKWRKDGYKWSTKAPVPKEWDPIKTLENISK